jgi:hypothetical protein
MSNDYSTYLVSDSRISQITDKREIEVANGASSSVYQQFQAISSNNLSIIFNIAVPSESVVVDRNILMQSKINLTIEIPGTEVKLNDIPFLYGLSNAFGPYPFNQLISSASASINNSSISSNVQDVISPLLRMNDSRELYRYNSITPSMPDFAFLNYADGIEANNNVLAGYQNYGYDLSLSPRGAFPFDYLKVVQTYTETAADGTTSVKTAQYINDGSKVVEDTSKALQAKSDGASFKVYISATFTEPLCTLSPFLFSDLNWSNKAGFLGLNGLNLTLNIDTLCRRVFRNSCQNPLINYNVSLGTEADSSRGFENTKLLLNFLSIPPTSLISTKNVLPMTNYVRYLSTDGQTSSIVAGATSVINSPNYQLSLLPKKFIIVVRKPMTSMTSKDSDSFLTINAIGINMANSSGILSNCSQQELWRMSIRNGSTQNFSEFCGKAAKATLQSFAYAGTTTNNFTSNVVKTTGSILVLNPAYDLSLGSADVTGGSIGQFSVQFQITVTNNYDTDVKPEIVMICANQGLITTQLGSSSLQTGMLTKQLVLETISKKKTYENAQQQHSLEGSGLDHEMSGGFASSSMSGGSLSLPTKPTRKAGNLKKYF